MSFVDLKDICVSYDGKTNVLNNLNISIEKGEFISLLGPSGCGKTTTLRVVAGLMDSNSGKLIVDGEDVTKIPVHKRNFGMVFQSYALFPHLTIFENVAFGLKLRKMDKDIIEKKVLEILEIVNLVTLKDRYPKQLSGGQRQRIALARALVIEPKLLLLDEPLSNLDAKLRVSMRNEIKRIQKELGITTIFVTHDQEECFSISDKVAIMNDGIIEQYDSPQNIYVNPTTEFVARFTGFENFIEFNKHDEGLYRAKDDSIFKIINIPEGEKTLGTIRPSDIVILEDDESKDTNIAKGEVEIRTFLGDDYQYHVSTELGKFIVNRSSDLIYNTGDLITLYFPENKMVLV